MARCWAGGTLGELIGLRETIGLIGMAGIALSLAAYLYSPLKVLRELPDPIALPQPVGTVVAAASVEYSQHG